MLLAIEIVDLLHITGIADACYWPISPKSLLNHIAWHTAEAAAMYSASVVDSAIKSCFFEL